MQSMDSIPAIVLCGGLGSRLKSVSGDTPKPMVKVAERPFLEYVLDFLISQGVTSAMLAVSYQKEAIIEHFGNRYKQLAIDYSIEPAPLGTGGAIKAALKQSRQCHTKQTLIINGDTYIEYQLDEMRRALTQSQADMVMCLKPMSDTSRYGRVVIGNNQVIDFEEKKGGQPGKINAGVYLISTQLQHYFPDKNRFSFESDFLEQGVKQHNVSYSISNGYFIDIGVPEDYFKAQHDFAIQNHTAERS